MSTTTANLGLFKYNTTTDANVSFNINTALNDNWDKIDAAVTGGSSRNIGEIVASTIPLTDAGLHLLDGALIDGAGIYSDFVSYMADLYGDGTDVPSYFCTEQEWQASVTTYGVCGKFVYNSTNNTVRLPKITSIVEGTTDLTALGDLVEAGLPNITGTFGCGNITKKANNTLITPDNISSDGAFHGTGAYNSSYINDTSGASWFLNGALGMDASRSSSIYGNSNTVQPQTIKALYYIVIATSTKTNIQVDIDEIATDLNEKVDKRDLAEVQCVVETYVNDSSWYRVYSDGWCEQGGIATCNTSGEGTITFLKPFVNTNYSFICDVGWRNDSSTWFIYPSSNYSQTTMYLKANLTGYTLYTRWQACGYII